MCLWGAVLCRCWNHLCYAKVVLHYVHRNRPVAGFIFQTDFEWCLAVRLTELKNLEWESMAAKIPIKAVKVPIGKI